MRLSRWVGYILAAGISSSTPGLPSSAPPPLAKIPPLASRLLAPRTGGEAPGRVTTPARPGSAHSEPPLALAIRESFPAVASRLEAAGELRPARQAVLGRESSGFLVSRGEGWVFLPSTYDQPFVAETGTQRVVLKALDARPAPADASGGLVAYEQVFEGVDALNVVRESGTEEYLLVREGSSRSSVEYEVLESAGVAQVVVRDGKVRFVGEGGGAPIELDRPWLIDAQGRRSTAAVAWEVARGGAGGRTRLRLAWNDGGLRYPLLIDPSFVVAGTFLAGRYNHTATLLADGRVLVAGGTGESSYSRTAELYDPTTGTSAATGSLSATRESHTATMLRNGKVLVVGGYNGSYLQGAELYDPATGTFKATGPLVAARAGHTAVLLPSGKVLVAGGRSASYLASAELFDPAANGGVGAFTATGALGTPRWGHSATLLASGKVLVAGGNSGTAWLSSAEIFDPSANAGAGAFAATGSLTSVHGYQTATLLTSGKVLVAGGLSGLADLFDPSANGGIGAFTSTGALATPRSFHSATLLPSGKVLVAGGWSETTPTTYLTSAELFDPAANAGAGAFAAAGSLAAPRARHAATLLPSGRVLFVGGTSYDSGLAKWFYPRGAEQYDPAAGVFSATGSLATAREYHSATLLLNGKTLITGGQGTAGYLATAELYDPAANAGAGAFTPTGSLATARGYHTATLLPSGKVLVVGGTSGSPLRSAELFDPAANSGVGAFTATGLPITARYLHTATLLPSGKVLVAGGFSGSTFLASAELFDPAASGGVGAFTSTGSLAGARDVHTATLLPDGTVLVAGGWNGSATLPSAELYSPLTGSFTATGSMVYERRSHTAALLPSGKVLIVGGSTSGAITSSAELYDPRAGTFSLTGFLNATRYDAAVAPLPSGKVLFAGGWSGSTLGTAELYDPAAEAFTATGSTVSVRRKSTATLLPNGRVLVAGGDPSSGYLATAELFSEGLGYPEAARPVLGSVTGSPSQYTPVAASGTLFTGRNGSGPEGSGGGMQSSATNYPLLQLRRLDNNETEFLPVDPAAGYTSTSFTSGRGWTLNPGPAVATVFTNGIPSAARALSVGCGLSIATQPQNRTVALGGTATFSVTAVGASSYQWQRDPTASGAWSDLDGATEPTYTIPAVVGQESGSRFRVLVRSACSVLPSDPATLTVSDGTFPTAAVVSPSGGEYWLLSPKGGPALAQTVSWSMSDDVRICRVDVSLRYSNNGGSSWQDAPAGVGLPASFGSGAACVFPGVATSNVVYAVPESFPSTQPGSLYRVRVVVTDQVGHATTAESRNPFYIVSPNPDSVRTLILHNIPRMVARNVDPALDPASLLGKLKELAAHPRVQGLVVDLSLVTSLTALYATWDADPGNPDKVNGLLFGTGGIHPYLRGLFYAYSGVKYVVLVGDDRVIPFARIRDGASLLPESRYVAGGNLTATGTTVGRALAADRFLSDDPLGVLDAVAPADTTGVLLVPDLAVGRLVEKGSEITTTISTFIGQDGVLDLSILDATSGHKVLVTGYDFLTSAATRIRDRWKSWLGDSGTASSLAPVDGSLVSLDWGGGTVPQRVSLLRTHLGGNGGTRYGVMGLLGHAAHYEEGVPGTNPTDIQGLSTLDIFGPDGCGSSAGALALAGGFVYAAGCHGGLPVPGTCSTDLEHSLDLPQTMLSRGVVAYLANTGYGWGLKHGSGYGTRLAELFTQELLTADTAVVGDAAVRAKRSYFLESPRFDSYDQKSLMQWSLFGLPMYVVKTRATASPSAPTAASAPRSEEGGEVEAIGSILVRRSLGPTAAPPSFLTQLTLHFDLSAQGVFQKRDADGNLVSGAGCPTADGCYYTLNGLVDRGLGDLPLLPYLVYDSRLSGTSQHGILWKGGRYVEETGFAPVLSTLVSNADPSTNLGSIARVAIIPPIGNRLVPGQDSPTCRPVDQELNTLTATAAEVAKANDTDDKFSIHRRYQTIDLEALYFNDSVTPGNNCDRTGPTLGTGPYSGAYHLLSGAVIQFAVPASDAAGVWRVVVVYTDNATDAQGNGLWTPLDLADDGTGVFRGGAGVASGRRVTYVIQAVDNRGNVTWLEYQSAVPPASGIPPGLALPIDVNVPTLPAVTVTGFLPAGGAVGTAVTVAGTGFSGATRVALNGLATSFLVVGDREILLQVPFGASSGPIQVTAPGGTGTSAASFRVLLPSATAVGSSANPSLLGQSVTFTATVTPVSGGGTPTGTVQFQADGTSLGSPVTLSGGGASVATSSLAAGAHVVTALYGGDGTFASSAGTLAGGQVVQPGLAGDRLYTVAPCRLIDTRTISPPAMAPGERRDFLAAGGCAISATAGAIALNVTVDSPTASGYLTLFPGGLATPPGTSVISFRQGAVRASNAIMMLGANGKLGIANVSAGTTHVIVDVVGYFE